MPVSAATANGRAPTTVSSKFGFSIGHFECYTVRPKRTFTPTSFAVLHDQFGDSHVQATAPQQLCNPAAKSVGGIVSARVNPNAHLFCYATRVDRHLAKPIVRVVNQFAPKGVRLVVVEPQISICLPSGKSTILNQAAPVAKGLDTYQCYKVLPLDHTTPYVKVKLKDQFDIAVVSIAAPYALCAPVNRSKVLAPIDSSDHLLCYRFTSYGPPFKQWPVFITNKLATLFPYLAVAPASVCAPSSKRVISQ